MFLLQLKSRIQLKHKCEKFNTRLFKILFISVVILESNFTLGNKEDLLDFIKLLVGLDSSNVTFVTEVMDILGTNHTEKFEFI